MHRSHAFSYVFSPRPRIISCVTRKQYVLSFNAAEASVTPGPGAGAAFPATTGPRFAVTLAASFPAGTGGGAILSDDGRQPWRLSAWANPKGGEAQIAVAQNGSLLLDPRGPAQGVRWEL